MRGAHKLCPCAPPPIPAPRPRPAPARLFLAPFPVGLSELHLDLSLSYLAGPDAYNNPKASGLKSLISNDGIFISVPMMAPMAKSYTNDKDRANPLAWPRFAKEADIKGLPPHVISTNECDPLCSEGVEYGQKLVRAGVDVHSRQVMGTCHVGDMLTPGKHFMTATCAAIKGFADSL